MNFNDKRVLALFEKSKKQYKETNPFLNIVDGAIYGAGLGFVTPGLVSSVAPQSFENAIKKRNIFGKDIANQMIESDRKTLSDNKNAELSKRSSLGEKISKVDYQKAAKEAAEEAQGFVKKPMNTNLFIQSGAGRWGAGIGASVVGINMARKRLSNKQKE